MGNFLDTLTQSLGRSLGGIPSMLGGFLSSGLNYLGTMQAQRQQQSMMDQQMAFSERMMDKQNAFNDPVRQAARLRAAGVNPALGEGTTPLEMNMSAGAQLPNAPAPPQFKVPESFGGLINSGISNVNEGDRVGAYVGLTKSQQFNMDLNNYILDNTKDTQIQREALKNDDYRAQIEERLKHAEEMKTHADTMDEQISINWYNADTERDLAKADIEKILAEANSIRRQQDNRDAITKAEIANYRSMIREREQQISLMKEQARVAAADACYREVLNQFLEDYPEFKASKYGIAKACTLLNLPDGFANVYEINYSQNTKIGPVSRSSSESTVVGVDGQGAQDVQTTGDMDRANNEDVKKANTKFVLDFVEKNKDVPKVQKSLRIRLKKCLDNSNIPADKRAEIMAQYNLYGL